MWAGRSFISGLGGCLRVAGKLFISFFAEILVGWLKAFNRSLFFLALFLMLVLQTIPCHGWESERLDMDGIDGPVKTGYSNSILLKVRVRGFMKNGLSNSDLFTKTKKIANGSGLDVRRVQLMFGLCGRRSDLNLKTPADSRSQGETILIRVTLGGGRATGENVKVLKNFSVKLAQLEEVESAEIERIYYISGAIEQAPSEDCLYEHTSWGDEIPWGLRAIHAQEAWSLTRGDSSVVVAIIDTGCDMAHPALKKRLWINKAEANGENGIDDDGNGFIDDTCGWDFVSAEEGLIADGEDGAPEDPYPEDLSGHGTHIAGIIVGLDEEEGISPGVAPGCRIMILRAGFRTVDGKEILLEGDVIRAIRYAVENGARIINMSFGGDDSGFLREAVEEASARGVLVVAAGGNSGSTEPVYPAGYDCVCGVSAIDSTFRLCAFSNRGSWVDCSAPGVFILSTVPGGYSVMSGTSQACAFVSGVSALIASLHREWDGELIRAQLKNTAVDYVELDQPIFIEPPLCRADLSLSRSPEARIEYMGCSVSPFREGTRFGLEMLCRLKNVWKGLDSLTVIAGLLNRPVNLVMKDSICTFGRLSPGEIITVKFHADLLNATSNPLELELKFTVDGGGVREVFEESVTINLSGAIKLFEYRVKELEGNGNRILEPGEYASLELIILNDSDASKRVMVRPFNLPDGVADAEIVEDSIVIPPHSVGNIYINFRIAEEVFPGSKIYLPIEVSTERDRTLFDVPVWVSFSGNGKGVEVSYQGDSGNSGRFPVSAGRIEGALWNRYFGGKGKITPQVLVADGLCYVALTRDDTLKVMALDERDGRTEWERVFTTEKNVDPLPVAYSRGVLCISAGSRMYGLYGESGEIIWVLESDEIHPGSTYRFGAPTINLSEVYVSAHCVDGAEGELVLDMDLFSGRVLWAFNAGKDVYLPNYALAVDGERVYAIDAVGRLLCLSNSGERVWEQILNTTPLSPPVVIGDAVIISASNRKVLVLDVNNGAPVMQLDVSGYPVGVCVFDGRKGYEGERVGIASLVNLNGGFLVDFLTSTSSHKVASVKLPFFNSRGILSGEKTVFVAGEDGWIAQIDPQDGDTPEVTLYREENFFSPSGVEEKLVPGVPFLAEDKLFVTYHSLSGDAVVAYSLSSGAEKPAPEVVLKNSPNPFNPFTRIEFNLDRNTDVSLSIYDVTGRLVRSFYINNARKGNNLIVWDGTDSRGEKVSSGIYFCRLRTPVYSVSTKMVLLR